VTNVCFCFVLFFVLSVCSMLSGGIRMVSRAELPRTQLRPTRPSRLVRLRYCAELLYYMIQLNTSFVWECGRDTSIVLIFLFPKEINY